MEDRDTVELELSVWWGVAALALIVGGGAIFAAQNLGPQAVETLLLSTLMLVFLVGGVLLGALIIQALGSCQRWGLANDEIELPVNHPSQQPGDLRVSVNLTEGDSLCSFEEEDDIDPFLEILKRNRSTKKAA